MTRPASLATFTLALAPASWVMNSAKADIVKIERELLVIE